MLAYDFEQPKQFIIALDVASSASQLINLSNYFN